MRVLSLVPSDEQDLLTGQVPTANKIAIMQPYFLPYLGYFQLIKAVNAFVVYDNIKYTKKGWINRNRILLNGKDTLFTIPLASSSDFLPISQKFIAIDFDNKKNISWPRSNKLTGRPPILMPSSLAWRPSLILKATTCSNLYFIPCK
ncbi:WbqC family protein [Paraflavitalea speifideaquila]|uniref:WbqC family protein n=1 Tax=Paraflavitalea speifideaquila TaxID=3076558 RepID=UPI0028E5EE72|nr:WbqC family protein [Paraflavitalea speifideiaquila]